LRRVAAAGGGRARAREREVRDEESRGEARQAGRHAGAHAPWLWRWRSSDSSSSAKGGELYGSRGCSSRSCCGARSLPRLVAGSRGGDVGASRCRQGWRPSLRPRWHSTNGRHPTPSHQHHHVHVRLQSAPGAVAPSRSACVSSRSLLKSLAVTTGPRVANWPGCGSFRFGSGGGCELVQSVVILGSPSRSGSLSHLYRAIVGSMSVSPTSSAPFANSLHVLTAHVARSASVLATCCYASLSLLKPVAVSICPRVANWRGCGSCCLVCGCEPIQCNR
jgi:hypothetical protein